MREIKFRAWDKETQKMGQVRMLEFDTYHSIVDGEVNHVQFVGNGWEDRDPENIILMQFTGLKDKHGKEIYEGDIVRFGENCTTVVKWDDELCGYVDPYYVIKPIESEVIGNIHENPELLKEQEQ